ncbi:hypothetical protein ACQ4LE_005993 [Meloidogyne hapla]|uniref:IlGF domain-containing protein n=1 Tax=Meloidogyne hapla TaxID=6305 RepID=A0A1I8B5S3_MELHA
MTFIPPLLLTTLLTLLQPQASFLNFNSAQALPVSMMNVFSYNPLIALFRNTDLNSRTKPFFSPPTSEFFPRTQFQQIENLKTIEKQQEQQQSSEFNNREILENKHPIEKQQKSETKLGALKLCPPGGRSFFEAFELACPMRKRKKRHTIIGISTQFQPKKITNMDYYDEDEEKQENKLKYRPANISEIMRICCVNGCEFSDFFPHCGPFSTW